MRHKVFKLFFAWQHEKEEAWLNQMSAQGLLLVNVGVCAYTFEEGTPGEYLYRLELLDKWPSGAEGIAYIRFLEETGIEHVASILRWAYFRRKASDGPFELYSDNSSRIKHCWRIIVMIGVAGVLNALQIPVNIQRLIDGYVNTTFIFLLAAHTLLTLLIAVGIISLYKKIRRLKKEQKFCE
jgi:hypothetical protein